MNLSYRWEESDQLHSRVALLLRKKLVVTIIKDVWAQSQSEGFGVEKKFISCRESNHDLSVV
jgi:hypothetical protein